MRVFDEIIPTHVFLVFLFNWGKKKGAKMGERQKNNRRPILFFYRQITTH